MRCHDVCIICLKTCKQPHSEWDDKEPEVKFCKNFDAPRSKLPIETLERMIETFPKTCEDGEVAGNLLGYLNFLREIRKVYIPCSKCGHMIAPDELYRIVDEQPICQRCVEA
jgi:hypothetical protein